MFVVRKILLIIVCLLLIQTVDANDDVSELTNGQWTSQTHHNDMINNDYYIVGKQRRRVVLDLESFTFNKEGEFIRNNQEDKEKNSEFRKRHFFERR